MCLMHVQDLHAQERPEKALISRWSWGSAQTGNKGLGGVVNFRSVEGVPQYTWAPQPKAEDLFQVLKEISARLLAEDGA